MNPKEHMKIFVIDEAKGEIICNCGCGMVAEEKLPDQEHVPIDKSLEKENKLWLSPNRSSLWRHNNNLPTEISSHNKDAAGKKLTAENQNLFYKLRWQNTRTIYGNTEERRLSHLLAEVGRICDALAMGDAIRSDASYLAIKLMKKDIPTRHFTTRSCILVFFAAKRANKERSLKEFFPFLGDHKRSFLSKMQEVQDQLEIEVKSEPKSFQLLENFCIEMQIKRPARMIAFKFLELYEKDKGNKSAQTRAAIAAYFAIKMYYGIKKTQAFKVTDRTRLTDVAEFFGVTYPTITKGLKDCEDMIYKNREVFN